MEPTIDTPDQRVAVSVVVTPPRLGRGDESSEVGSNSRSNPSAHVSVGGSRPQMDDSSGPSSRPDPSEHVSEDESPDVSEVDTPDDPYGVAPIGRRPSAEVFPDAFLEVQAPHLARTASGPITSLHESFSDVPLSHRRTKSLGVALTRNIPDAPDEIPETSIRKASSRQSYDVPPESGNVEFHYHGGGRTLEGLQDKAVPWLPTRVAYDITPKHIVIFRGMALSEKLLEDSYEEDLDLVIPNCTVYKLKPSRNGEEPHGSMRGPSHQVPPDGYCLFLAEDNSEEKARELVNALTAATSKIGYPLAIVGRQEEYKVKDSRGLEQNGERKWHNIQSSRPKAASAAWISEFRLDYPVVLLFTTVLTIAAIWSIRSVIPLVGLSVIYSALGAGYMRGLVTYINKHFNKNYTDGGKSYEWLIYLLILWLITAIQLSLENPSSGGSVTCTGVNIIGGQESSGSLISFTGDMHYSNLKMWGVTTDTITDLPSSLPSSSLAPSNSPSFHQSSLSAANISSVPTPLSSSPTQPPSQVRRRRKLQESIVSNAAIEFLPTEIESGSGTFYVNRSTLIVSGKLEGVSLVATNCKGRETSAALLGISTAVLLVAILSVGLTLVRYRDGKKAQKCDSVRDFYVLLDGDLRRLLGGDPRTGWRCCDIEVQHLAPYCIVPDIARGGVVGIFKKPGWLKDDQSVALAG